MLNYNQKIRILKIRQPSYFQHLQIKIKYLFYKKSAYRTDRHSLFANIMAHLL